MRRDSRKSKRRVPCAERGEGVADVGPPRVNPDACRPGCVAITADAELQNIIHPPLPRDGQELVIKAATPAIRSSRVPSGLPTGPHASMTHASKSMARLQYQALSWSPRRLSVPAPSTTPPYPSPLICRVPRTPRRKSPTWRRREKIHTASGKTAPRSRLQMGLQRRGE